MLWLDKHVILMSWLVGCMKFGLVEKAIAAIGVGWVQQGSVQVETQRLLSLVMSLACTFEAQDIGRGYLERHNGTFVRLLGLGLVEPTAATVEVLLLLMRGGHGKVAVVLEDGLGCRSTTAAAESSAPVLHVHRTALAATATPTRNATAPRR